MPSYEAGRAHVSVSPDLTGFQRKIDAGLRRMNPQVKVGLEVDNAAMARLRAQLNAIAAPKVRVEVDLDGGAAAIARLRAIQDLCDKLDGRKVRIKLEIDGAAAALAQITALKAALDGLGDRRIRITGLNDASQAAGRLNGQLGNTKLLVGAIAAGVPLISSALVALPGLASAVVTPVAAIAVGFDGVKKSVQSLEPAFERMQDSVSDVFERKLAPAISDINRMMPTLQRGLEGSATSTTRFARAITNVVSSQAGLERINSTFANSNELLERLGPGAGIATANILRLADEGSRALVPMTGELTKMSLAWRDSIDQMSRSGELEAGIQGLAQVIGSLGAMIPAIVELGNALTGAFGPSIASAIDLTTGAINVATDAFRLIPQPINDGVVAIGAMVLALKALRAVMATGAVTAGVAALGTAAALTATRMGASQGAVTRMGSAADRLGRSMPYVGAALIAGAIAGDKWTTSISEAETQMMSGEKSIDELADEMSNLYTSMLGSIPVIGETAAGWFGLATSQEDARRKLEALRASWDPLTRAQVDARFAQDQWNEAVNRHGPTSDQAKAAAERLGVAVDALEGQERELAEATKTATDRLVEQRDQMLASVDADLAMRQAKLGVREAQDALNAAIRDHGPNSIEAQRASLEYEASLSRVAAAVAEATRQQYAHLGPTEANKLAVRAQTEEIMALVRASGTDIPPALAAMAGSIDAARWAAEGARIETNQFGETFARLPDGKVIKLDADTEAARAEIEAVARAQYWATIKVRMEQVGGWGGGMAAGGASGGGIRDGRIVHRAVGGPVIGPGSGTSDSIMAMDPAKQQMYRLSNGEWIMTAAAVAGAGGFAGMAQLMKLLEQSKGRAAGGQIGTGAAGGGGGLSITGSVKGGIPLTPESLKTLAAGLKELVSGALQPLVDHVTGSTAPVLKSLQDVIKQGAVTTDVAAKIQEAAHLNLAAIVQQATASQVGSTQQQGAAHHQLTSQVQLATATQTVANQTNALNLNTSTIAMQGSISRLQAASNSSWQNMQQVTGQNVNTITGPIFGGLNAGMAGVQQVATNTAAAWSQQLNTMREAAASPIRWIMQWPLGPPGIAASWNELDRQFALGKHITMPAPGFASGGRVTGPGSGTSDSIMARLSAGEFVVREKVASMVPHFLKALNSGQPEAIQAAGGRKAHMPGFAAGGVVPAVQRAQDWARSQAGKRYVWGGVGPGGYDCSGWISAITNVLRNQQPHRRLGTTATFPWGGFANGLLGAFSVGAFKGSPGHMAGTLGGVNVEAGGAHNTNAYGGPAVGADHRQFNIRAHLPEIGGVFAPGGAGGGAAFDPGPIVDAAFKRTYDLINDITKWFGMSNVVTGLQSISRQAADAVKAKAMEKLATAAVGPGPGGGVERWRPMVHRALGIVGQPLSMDNITLRRMNQESGGNPNAVNNWDSNAAAGHPSVGLMQVIRGTYASYKHPQFDMGPYMHGVSVDPLSNTLASMRYAMARYGSLPAAYNRPGGYDEGGWLQPGITHVYNGTRKPEAVLTQDQWKAVAVGRGSGEGVRIYQQLPHTASPEQFADSALFAMRRAKRSGLVRNR